VDSDQRHAIESMLDARITRLSRQLDQHVDSHARSLTAKYRREVETCGPLQADSVVEDICTAAQNSYRELIDQMATGVAAIEQELAETLRRMGINHDEPGLSPDTSVHDVVGEMDASGLVADELATESLTSVMAGIGAAAMTKGLFVAALKASLAGTVRPALFRVAMFGLGRTAFVAGMGGAAVGGAAGTAQAASASIIFGPAGWVIGGTMTGATMYRGWRKAKRKNAKFVLDQAAEGLRGAAADLRAALADARDRVIAALSNDH
jgi:hypothetical protein